MVRIGVVVRADGAERLEDGEGDVAGDPEPEHQREDGVAGPAGEEADGALPPRGAQNGTADEKGEGRDGEEYEERVVAEAESRIGVEEGVGGAGGAAAGAEDAGHRVEGAPVPGGEVDRLVEPDDEQPYRDADESGDGDEAFW